MQQRCIPTKKSNKHNDFYLLCSAFAYPYGTFAFELQNSLYYDKEKKSESQTTDRKQKCGRVTQISDTLWPKSKRLRRR